jgi:hypothetical protein
MYRAINMLLANIVKNTFMVDVINLCDDVAWPCEAWRDVGIALGRA